MCADTDGDGLDDYDDIILGFSPLLQDTDGNGVLDPDEKIYQTVENNFPINDGRGIIKVEVSMDINGNIDKKVGISNVYEIDRLSSNVVGLIGVPVEIRSNASFDTATIQFTYDEAAIISFESSAKIVSDFTNNQIELSNKVNSLTAYGGTNVNSGLLKALEVFDGRETDRRRIIVLICDGDVNYYQISRDLPVVFSFYTSSKNKENWLKLYSELEYAKKEKNEEEPESVQSHYMTIIGYSKYLKDDGISYSYILKVVSWGKIYYIDYDEYADKINYFTNILEIN